MNARRLIVIILTVCMIVTYMPITRYAYADETGNDQETGSEAIGSADVSMPSNDGSDESAGIPDTEEKAAIRALSGEAQREALDEYLDSETAENDIIEAESGLDFNTYDLGENTRAKVFFSYPVRYEDENGDLVEIEPELIETDSKDTSAPRGYSYENKSGLYKTYIPASLSTDIPILLENDKYTFTMAPAVFNSNDAQVSVGDVKATYGSDEDAIKLEYISQNDGIKENIILNERPSSKEITFKLTFDNMTYSMNPTDNGITFYDEETDEIIMGIESPFMNDATGEAYSEDLEYEVIDPEEGEDTYTLKLKISDKYLDDPGRVYPVTIDPTATWVGTSEVRDSYVISGFPTTNFYSTSTVVMPSGSGTQGVHRTYIHILNLKSELIGANISSAAFDIYETGGGVSGKNVRVYRITEDWTNSTVTWNNKPDIASGFIDSITTNGTANHKMSYDVTSWAQKVVSESVHNYGLCLRNKTESGSTYTEFYGSRTGTTARRPKLTVVYTDDKPTQATKVRTDSPYAEGSKVYVRWEGVTANKLQCIQYKIAKLNASGEITDANYVSYTSIGSAASSGRHSIPNSANFPKGYYRVYIRGLSKQGITGKYNSVKFRIEDKATKPSSVTVSPDNIYTGDSLTVSWAGLTGSFLSKAEYKIVKLNSSGGISNSKYVPYTTLKTNPSSSGSATISGKIKDAGTYKVYVRGVNSSGIVGEARESAAITVTKDDAPSIGSITLSKGNDTIDQSEYIKSGNISVSVTGITDDRSLNNVTGSYRLLKNGNVVDSGSNITLTQSGSSYNASFNISQAVFEASGDYTVEFSLTDIGGNTGTETANLKIDDEAPTADIELLDLPQEGMLNIPFYAQDKHSGIDNIDLKLYHGSGNDLGQFVMDLANNITDEKTVTLDASTLQNGPYTLKLTATDNAGNTAELYRDFDVYNRVGKPGITVMTQNNGAELRVDWSYSSTPSGLDHLEYSLNDGDWVSVSDSNTAQGYFTVSVTGLTGTNHIRVRGVDSNDVEGDAARREFTIDPVPPAVDLTAVTRGILSGSVTDTNLRKWELFIKETNANDSTYAKIGEGKNTAVNGRICFVDLSGGTYTNNTSYTLKLKATDKAGNVTDDTISFTYRSSWSAASFLGTADRVKRNLGQSYSADTFLMTVNDDNEVTLDISGDTELSNISWYLNNSYIGTGRTLTYELTGTELTGSNDIFFTAEDSLGNIVLSRDLYVDSNEEIIPFDTPASGQIVQEEVLSEEAAALRFDLPEDSAVTYSVKVGSGSYHQISSGELVYISDLDSDIVKTDTFTIKAEGAQRTLQSLEDFAVYITTYSEESFAVTTAPMEAYWPEGFRAVDKINYKTYLYWDVPEGLPNDISYEVHRSTEEDFDPSDSTLVAEDIREGYWCDINLNYEVDLYYKVRGVQKENDIVVGASSFTDCRTASAISRNEYLKHLGHKEYWGYAEVKTPNGTGYIEKFDGNFFYSASDATVPNESLPISFTRSYNSGSTSRSSLGYGWTHNYDIALIKVGSDEDLENSTLALRDGQGTIYTFSRVNGTYVSSMGKYLTLKEESTSHNYTVTSGNSTEQFSFASNYTMFSRDGMKFYFDEYGKLLLIEEANGNILIFSYDPERGLLEKITTGRGINIDFIYYDGDNGTDPLTIKEMRLPDGSKTVYGYTSGSRLNSVKNYPVNPANQNDCITYNYTYSNKKMVGLTDGSGNAYSITYGSDPRTVTFAYPSIQNQAAEGTRVTVGNTTVTERLIGGSAVTREEDTFDSFGQVIEHRIYTGNEYVSETYYYVNNLVATETTKQVYDILELSDDGMSGTITKAEKEVAVEHLYDGNDNSISDSYDTINDKVSEVDYSYDSNGTTEWNEYLPVETTETIDGVVVSHEESEYDAAGNLTESKDYTNHELIEYMYADGTGSEPKGTLVSEENWLMNSNGQKAGLISSMETTVSYSGTNKIETVTNDAGDDRIVEETTYDQMGRVTERIVYTYTDYGQTSQKISKERHQYTFDGYGRVAAETTTTSNVNANLVNISGTVVTKSSTKSYYPNGALASETDERGVTSSYTYDALNRLVSTTVSKGNQTQTTTTSYSYGPVTIHDGKGGTLSYSNCLITTESDGNLEIHKTYQDGQGRVVREIDDGVITDYSYDLNGNRVIDFLVTEKAQDIQDEEGITTYTLYNEEGTAYGSVIEPAWENDRFIITEDSIVEVNYFDDRGNISGSRDPLGNITEFGYDQENRLTSVTLPDTGTNITTFNYSESSNNSGDYTSTVTMTDALGARSVEVSDASGNTVSISDNGKQNENITAIATQFEHDGAGRVTKEIKMSGEYITYSYDSSGRLTQRSEFTSTNTELTRTVYTYVGTTENILSMSDYRIENGSPVLYHYEEFGYDNLGRMISKAEINGASFPSDLTPYTISYSYDIHDNITGIVYGSAIPTEISSINYTYSGERLTSVSAVINNVEYLLKEYTYTDWGAVETVKDYYDFKTSGTSKYILLTYGYDRLTNLFEMVYTKEDDTVIESHYYSYDKAGKIITEENYSSLSDFNEIRRFEYDSLGRLVLSDIKDIVEESGNTSEENKLITEYTYDKVGNRLTKTENGEETAYVYNGLDQLLTETKGTDTLTYSYDSNGNQTGVTGTSDGETVSKTMTYTPGGMMETYSDGERVEQNTYIRGETRIKKAEGPSLQNLTDITNYFYQEGSVLYTTDNDNEAKSFNLLNISDIFATEREGENTEEHYFYLDDIRGSKTELIDNSAGNIVSYWYNDFGEVSEERNEDYEDFINEVQYTGAIYDGSTGLLYLNARFYDPATGSFTSQDSYRGERGEPDSWHLYAYCADDPVNCVDPNGHKWVLVGTGLQIGLSLGCLWKTFCCGIDIIWFNSYLKRYNNRSMHIYAVYGANYSCATFNKLLGTTKLKPFNLFSNRGVKGIAKSLLKGANIAVHASLIQADTKMYKSYLNYEKGGLYFSVGAGAVATVSTGGSNMTIGLGVSSSKVFSMSLGWTYTKFLSNVTASTRSFFDKIESTARNRANTLKSNPSGHCGIAK